MKRFKITTCLVLVALLVLSGMTALAGTKYSNSEDLGNVQVRPTATPKPTEEPLPPEEPETTPAPIQFERDADGNLLLDENGNPIVLLPEGVNAPSGFERDEEGNLVLDENGNPIPTFEEDEEPAVEPTEEPADPEASEEPAVEPTEEPADPEASAEPEVTPEPEVTSEPSVEPSVEPAVEPAEEPAPEIGYTYQRDEAGNLVLDENGDPIVTIPEGWEIPVTWLRDENGNLVLDENGNPIPDQTIPADAEKMQTITDALNPDRYIDIYAAWEGDQLYFGETATLIAVLHGYDNLVYTVQWQYSVDNAEWHDVEGGNDSRYSLTVTEDNYLNYWRIQVQISDVK